MSSNFTYNILTGALVIGLSMILLFGLDSAAWISSQAHLIADKIECNPKQSCVLLVLGAVSALGFIRKNQKREHAMEQAQELLFARLETLAGDLVEVMNEVEEIAGVEAEETETSETGEDDGMTPETVTVSGSIDTIEIQADEVEVTGATRVEVRS
ncbi:MAG: hypothetical protein Q9160_003590 [Pyrenula sp. 1 TL-2023]